MSLTETHDVFVGVHESALNDLLHAICTARPHLLRYGSPAFVPIDTVDETAIPAITFPGIPGGIDWQVRFTIPRIDLFPQTDDLPPELTPLPAGAFSIRTVVQLCVACRTIEVDPYPPKGQDPRVFTGADTNGRQSPGKPTCCRLELFAVGHPVRAFTGTGEDGLTFALDRLEIVDVTPDDLESVLECVLTMVLQAVLATVRIPIRALRLGAFALSVTEGPLVEDDRVKARGDF